MSTVAYESGSMTFTLEGLEEVSRALKSLKDKTPAAAKVAINAAARESRKLLIAQAKARYAVNAAGQKQLKELRQRRKATNTSLLAELHIASLRNDLGYFKTSPSTPLMGGAVARAPAWFKGHVLKSTSLVPLSGAAGLSKGFLVEFKSGHVGMVQRLEGTGRFHYTARSGAPSTSDKMQTMGSPSSTAMHNKVWPLVEPGVEDLLIERLHLQVQKVLARAGRQ